MYYQLLSESTEFCRRYDKNMLAYFFLGHDVCIDINPFHAIILTRSSSTAKSTARPSCLVDVLYDISREKIC